MAWLARSIANSLRFDDGDSDGEDVGVDGGVNRTTSAIAEDSPPQSNDDQLRQIGSQSVSPSSSTATPKGVKEDFSELTKTLGRQLWGVAAFLAPAPEPSVSREISDSKPYPQSSDRGEIHEVSDDDVSDEAVLAGIRSDFAEISGKFKTGISKLSNNIAVSEISKIASNFLQFGSEEVYLEKYEADGVVGVTEEVLAFANNIAMHPETWLDFPLPDTEEFDGFDLSDAQQEHALAVERLAPRLAALRIELSPGYMTESCFWMIYFVLVHPRLNKHDAELLSTPQIVEVRAMLMQQLQSKSTAKPLPDLSGIESSHEEHLSVPSSVQSESVSLHESSTKAAPSIIVNDREIEKHPVQSTEIQIIDKSVVEEEPINQIKHQHSLSDSSSKVWDEKYEDDADDWLKEENSESVGVSATTMPLGNDEDISFSDLEDDEEDVSTNLKTVTYSSDSSAKNSRDWVQL